jgi:Holliday junction DNA helicase RuvA
VIASLRGAVLSKTQDGVVLEAAGVGYEVCVTATTAAALPESGRSVLLYIAESVAMYGGGVTLYGFLAPSDKAMFLALRDNVPGTGAKKALEFLDKASRSLPDFRRAVLDKDAKVLIGVFGFTRKTADKLIDGLKDCIAEVSVPGAERLTRAGGAVVAPAAMGQALSALAALGYKTAEARAALASVAEEHPGEALDAERIIRLALKRL